MSPAQTMVSRLAYIRFLHQLAVDQARLPAPMSSVAVLMLHDAVESFLLLCAEHLNAPGSHEFEKYWDVLSPARLSNGVELSARPGMKRLNKVRVALKHHGAHPDKATIDLLVEDTAAFFAANTTAVFGLDYTTISLAEVITDETVRQLVRDAETASADGDHIAAMIALADGLDELFDPPGRAAQAWGPSPLEFGPTPHAVERSKLSAVLQAAEQAGRRRGSRDSDHLARQISEISEVVIELQAAMRITVLGIDFAAYQRFRTLTPAISKTWGGRSYRAPVGYAPSRDEVDFCLHFVVDAAIRLTAADAQLALPSWRSTERPYHVEKWETIAEKTTSDR